MATRVFCCVSDDPPAPPDLDIHPPRDRRLSGVFRLINSPTPPNQLPLISNAKHGTTNSKTNALMSDIDDDMEAAPLQSDSAPSQLEGDSEDDMEPVNEQEQKAVDTKLRYVHTDLI